MPFERYNGAPPPEIGLHGQAAAATYLQDRPGRRAGPAPSVGRVRRSLTETPEISWQALLAIAGESRRSGRKRRDAGGAADHAGTADPLYRVCYAGLIDAMARQPFVIGQIGQSLDGRIATESGHSNFINGAASLDHLHRLRGLVDAVVVGATTVQLDNPSLTTRRVAGPNPARVVIDPNGRLDPECRLLNDAAAKTFVITAPGRGRSSDGCFEIIELAIEGEVIPPAAILAALQDRGLSAVLVEGGSRTLSAFVDAGQVDRLHMMVAPLILGSGRPGLQLPPIARLEEARQPAVLLYRLGDDVLFDCDLRPPSADAAL